MNKSIIVLAILLITGLGAHATEAPTMDLGKTLFESIELGSKGRACVTCHAQGKGLDLVGDFNFCVYQISSRVGRGWGACLETIIESVATTFDEYLIGEIPAAARTLDIAGAVLHDYGKAPRPGRKLGHITVVADTAAERDEKLAAIGETVTGSTPEFGTVE